MSVNVEELAAFADEFHIRPINPVHAHRCYEIAAMRVAFGPDDSALFTGYEGARLVNGTVQGAGHPPLQHAWVIEPDGSVYEPTTDHVYTARAFVVLFNPVVEVEYSASEVRRQISRSHHTGPWHYEG